MFEQIEQPSFFSKIKAKHLLVIGGVIGVMGMIGIGIYFYQQSQQYYNEARTGIIRGNLKSRIYHLPHCPNYNGISPNHIIEFQTIAEAENKKFRASQNCPNNIVTIRRTFENK